MKMGETKQVRVDNWGIFFLQRLQVFFSKTDYCDLTLQFEGNVQLKVHRLVMCACTEYFNLLEQSCPALEENTILMPHDLQADVIVPIVNFMYTGMLEFHMSIFERLYKAAELMNITVLTKLLDAQKVLPNYKSMKRKSESPHNWNLQAQKTSSKVHKSPSELPATLPGRKLPVWKRKSVPSTPTHPASQLQFSEQRYPTDPLSLPDSTPKPTRFEWPDEDLPQLSMMDTSFEDISYTSKPLLTQQEARASTSFDDVRRNANEQTKDDEDSSDYSQQKRKLDSAADRTSPKRIKLNDKENKEATINIKSSNGGDLDHAKIVSEILKKYPQLVKKNKNIRLKIMASGNKNVEQTVVQPLQSPVKTPTQPKAKVQVEVPKTKITKPVKPKLEKPPQIIEEGPWVCNKCNEAGEAPQEFVLYYLYRKHMTDMHYEKFDTRLCKYCGQWCGKHNLMMYHLYTKHGLKPSNSHNFPKCDQCPYIALSPRNLTQHKLHHESGEMQCLDCQLAFTSKQTLTAHIQITGHVKKKGNNSFDCQYCTKRLQSTINLFTHIKNSHLKEAKRDGIVILDDMEEMENDDEEEEEEEEEEDEDTVIQKDKVKIISNVKVPARIEQTNTTVPETTRLEPSSESEALNNVASGIATSLGLVDIVVLDDNQQYILQQQEDQAGQPEFIIPDLTTTENHFSGQVITTQHSTVLPQNMLQTTGGDIGSTDELVMVLTDHDYQDEQEGVAADNSNIVVLYSHPVDGQQSQFITSQGNLLVNSQTGMLEIRNEAITTTASNQIMVNTSVDTSESIESIQREIQSHREMKREPYCGEEPKSNVQHPQPDVGEVSEQLENTNEETEISAVENANQETTNEKLPLENYQEEVTPPEAAEEHDAITEPVDKEENTEATEETSHVEEENPVKEQSQDNVDGRDVSLEEPMETDEVEQPALNEKASQPAVEESILPEQDQEETCTPPAPAPSEEINTEGIDVPPTEAKDYVEDNPLESPIVIFNDPNNMGEEHSPKIVCENTVSESEDVPEPMEVDGGKMNSPHQEGVDEADVAESINTDLKEPEGMEDQLEGPTENKESVVNDIEDGTSLDQPPPPEEVSELEYQHQSETDNSQYNEDEDENSQSSQGTARSQEASINKNQVNIDQAILEDWEDTDSQQSEKQRVAIKQAAENVNKLMDDWEEEDEDDKKEGD